MDMLFTRITIYPKEEYADCYIQAIEIIKDIDPDDAPFLALAMKTKVDGIWSEDKGFQQQNVVKIYTTKELCNYSAYKTLSMATMLYFYNILGISKSILKDICHQFFTKSYQMYFRYQ
jgi:predicted nucleic acid-binding protein